MKLNKLMKKYLRQFIMELLKLQFNKLKCMVIMKVIQDHQQVKDYYNLTYGIISLKTDMIGIQLNKK